MIKKATAGIESGRKSFLVLGASIDKLKNVCESKYEHLVCITVIL